VDAMSVGFSFIC